MPLRDFRKVIIITQARINSSRLYGKSMKKILNQPVLYWHLKQLKKSRKAKTIVVATSKSKLDNKIFNYCSENKVNVFRGSLNDVLSRYYYAAKKFKCDIIVRVTSDCPLIDPKFIDQAISIFKKNKLDYLANTNPPFNCTYTDGMDVEVFTFSALERAFKNCKNKKDREHVTYYFWKNKKKFITKKLNLKKSFRHYRLTLDYKEDFNLIRKIIETFTKNKISISFNNVIKFLDRNKKLAYINSKRNLEYNEIL